MKKISRPDEILEILGYGVEELQLEWIESDE